jgi:hypothetical protein
VLKDYHAAGWHKEFAGRVRRIRLWLEGDIGSGNEIVGDESIVFVKVESYAGGDGLESLGIDLADDRDDRVGVARGFDGVSARTEKEADTRERSAGGELQVEHVVNLAKLRVGSVAGVARAANSSEKKQGGEHRDNQVNWVVVSGACEPVVRRHRG